LSLLLQRFGGEVREGELTRHKLPTGTEFCATKRVQGGERNKKIREKDKYTVESRGNLQVQRIVEWGRYETSGVWQSLQVSRPPLNVLHKGEEGVLGRTGLIWLLFILAKRSRVTVRVVPRNKK